MTEGFAEKLRNRTPDDTLWYAIFPDFVLQNHTDNVADSELKELSLHILDSVSEYVADYIWQHQNFNLDISIPTASSTRCPCLADSGTTALPHLHGAVRYGDNMEDEWFAVFLIFEITRRFPEVSARVWDTDGEFLLIEAAYAIPRWLKPESSLNRVFIRRGDVHIIPLSASGNSAVSLSEGLSSVCGGDVQTRAKDSVQQCVARKIGEYPAKARQNMHQVRATVPVAVAQILKHEPHMIALAVEAFYDRDVDSMKAAMKMEKFLESKEMVDVSIKMSRAMYGQLFQQMFQAPRSYPMPSISSPKFKEAELGMKISCGFEMMYQQRKQYEDCVNVDVNAGENSKLKAVKSKDVGWLSYKKALDNRGYFRGLLEGSQEYRRLLDEALEFYTRSNLFSKMNNVMHHPIRRIDEVLAQPHSSTDFDVLELPPSDDDSWLYDGEGDLNATLTERLMEKEAYEKRKLKKKQSKDDVGNSSKSKEAMDSFDLESVVSGLHSFVDKMSSYEGADVPSDRNSETVSMDMKQFLKELKLATGMDIGSSEDPLHDETMEDSEYSSSDMDFDESDSEGGSVEGATKMDIHKHDTEASGDGFQGAYAEALDEQLRDSTLTKSFVRAEDPSSSSKKQRTEVTENQEELCPVDIDFNLVQSMLDSFSSQQGLPGPASNILGLMGLQLPDDSKRKPGT